MAAKKKKVAKSSIVKKPAAKKVAAKLHHTKKTVSTKLAAKKKSVGKKITKAVHNVKNECNDMFHKEGCGHMPTKAECHDNKKHEKGIICKISCFIKDLFS